MKRVFFTTDTHGCLDQLKKVLEEANFDYENDTLIHGGDCVDRGPNSWGVIEFLDGIKNLISLKGNHDDWFLTAIKEGFHPAPGYFNETSYSYRQNANEYPETSTENEDVSSRKLKVPYHHIKFLENQRAYYIDEQNRMFCHAGFETDMKVEDQVESTFFWDRDLITRAMCVAPGQKLNDVNHFKRIFIGHTPTINWTERQAGQYNDGNFDEVTKFIDEKWPMRCVKPIYKGQVVQCDTGGCFNGRISLLDITDDDAHLLYQA